MFYSDGIPGDVALPDVPSRRLGLPLRDDPDLGPRHRALFSSVKVSGFAPTSLFIPHWDCCIYDKFKVVLLPWCGFIAKWKRLGFGQTQRLTSSKGKV